MGIGFGGDVGNGDGDSGGEEMVEVVDNKGMDNVPRSGKARRRQKKGPEHHSAGPRTGNTACYPHLSKVAVGERKTRRRHEQGWEGG